jgi:hypothetical protein
MAVVKLVMFTIPLHKVFALSVNKKSGVKILWGFLWTDRGVTQGWPLSCRSKPYPHSYPSCFLLPATKVSICMDIASYPNPSSIHGYPSIYADEWEDREPDKTVRAGVAWRNMVRYGRCYVFYPRGGIAGNQGCPLVMRRNKGRGQDWWWEGRRKSRSR